jgi:hemerythrin-like domain-containing protein
MKRALPLVPDETEALLWAPWRMLESDHDSFMVELRELEHLLKRYPSQKPCPVSLLGRMDRFILQFESHMGSHFKAEERAVFPFLRRHAPHLEGTLLYLIAEHEGIRRTLAAWKRSFRKTKTLAKPRRDKVSLSTQGLELIRLLRVHVERESRIMRQFPSKAA